MVGRVKAFLREVCVCFMKGLREKEIGSRPNLSRPSIGIAGWLVTPNLYLFQLEQTKAQ